MMNATIRPLRGTYRHGDLRRALVEAGVDLARSGGPEAVTLREATRRAGVVPNAAYRHFAGQQDLLHAVRSTALSAIARSMEVELSTIAPDVSPAAFAKASLRAVGRGYLRFARTEPGLFRTAFGTGPQPGKPPRTQSFEVDPTSNVNRPLRPGAPELDTCNLVLSNSNAEQAGSIGLNPFQLLSMALDRMEAAQLLPPKRRAGAEYLAWSAVHGLAMLVIEGPLQIMNDEQIEDLIPRLLLMVERGL